MGKALPSGDRLLRALRWLDEEHDDRPELPMVALIEEVSAELELSAVEEEWLLRVFAPRPGAPAHP